MLGLLIKTQTSEFLVRCSNLENIFITAVHIYQFISSLALIMNSAFIHKIHCSTDLESQDSEGEQSRTSRDVWWTL